MTNQEIDEKINAALTGVWYRTEAEGLRLVYRAALSQAYEEAAAADCPSCRSGTPAHQYYGGDWYHLDERGHDFPCLGSNARALRDSLQVAGGRNDG